MTRGEAAFLMLLAMMLGWVCGYWIPRESAEPVKSFCEDRMRKLLVQGTTVEELIEIMERCDRVGR